MPSRILLAGENQPHGAWLRTIPETDLVEAGTGASALQLARTDDFALMVLASDLPDMECFSLLAQLRKEPRALATPVIFVDRAANPEAALRAYEMGAVDCVNPATMRRESLVPKAAVLVGLHRQRRQLEVRIGALLEEQDRLRAQATHDMLTGLPNRTLFIDRLEPAVARAARHSRRFAVACLDLDRFKLVNDQHGHATGDAVLVAVAERLRKALRATDTVARLGGDEFGLLFEELEHGDDAARVAQKVHRAVTAPLTLRSYTLEASVAIPVAASMGVAIYPDHATGAADLRVLADLTMYAVKRTGGGARIFPGQLGKNLPGAASRRRARPT